MSGARSNAASTVNSALVEPGAREQQATVEWYLRTVLVKCSPDHDMVKLKSGSGRDIEQRQANCDVRQDCSGD